ncbi:Xaa-Pro aminopeptidase (EC [Olavius algarvensis Delta 1 endosymbiont]|nr:Xaa-Pro aminopeptidase (EC [Olavius algarvensis Delta 1 endosymbiont]
MFPASTYIERRSRLKETLKSGVLLFLGNVQSPINCPDNVYTFRQDSSFLYFWGIDLPGLAAIIDIDQNREIVFGREVTLDDIIWSGPQTALKEHCLASGIEDLRSPDQLEAALGEARQTDRNVHFLPQYRAENVIKIQQLLGLDPAESNRHTSLSFIKAVVNQRSSKSAEEIREIEAALDVTFEMQTLSMKISRPGMYEKEVVGAMEGLAYSRSNSKPAFPIIFTTRGQILHNPFHKNLMQANDLVINDCGCESAMHYASDITRTFPVGGKFSDRQKEIYSIVLKAQINAVESVRPGIEYREIHTSAARSVTVDLIDLGLMKGDAEEAVAAGAHALFNPAGLGHMLGLDVHDMEDLGEDYVGYTDTIQRNPQFGINRLRLARKLEPGFVITVEPGIYFMPELIDKWKAEKKFEEYINYAELEAYRDFGGIRIEDDVLVHDEGQRLLGRPIPKSIEAVEELSS